MKQTSMMLILFGLMLVGCTESSKKSSSSTSAVSPYCAQFPTAMGCSGTTTGGSTGGTCSIGSNNNTVPGCPGYCAVNPSHADCGGGTTGGSTGGSTGGYNQTMPNNNWQSLYPYGQPSGSCSTATGTGYETRKGTITIAGGTWYSPDNAWTMVGEAEYKNVSYSHNNSPYLVSVTDAKGFLDTDAKLRIRFKPRAQSLPPTGKSWCYNRTTGQSGNTYGYGTLKFSVGVKGLNADGSVKSVFDKIHTNVVANVNSCSPALDFDDSAQRNPYGIVLVVYDVQSDQGCWQAGNCTAFTSVKTGSCWSMDIEASVDGTKNIN